MQAVIDRYNNVPVGDTAKRFTQHQIVMGWQPSVSQDVAWQNPCFPFLPIYNDAATTVTGTALPDTGFQNEWRVKGSFNPNIDPTDATIVDNQWVWSTAMTHEKPVILDGVSLFMLHDSCYLNDFQYGNPPPHGKQNNEIVDDLFLEVTIDDPFMKENRTLNAVEYHKSRWKVDCEFFQVHAVPGFTDLSPGHPGGEPVGVALNALGLNIPLAAQARVRFSIAVPQYRAAYSTSWTTKPWTGCNISAVVTILDPVLEA
jgi:hypothetical protein